MDTDTHTDTGGNRDGKTTAPAAFEPPVTMRRREPHGRIRTHRPAVADGTTADGAVEGNIVRGED
ncbi:hypothetical protein ACF068_19990 [Streptomyces sp. NPDC016309]|uniref:hypothetical protein n=1 Tax=Streptomyces sp. NPDC016309 TaxID=3364965 RepID=UPI0036F74B91